MREIRLKHILARNDGGIWGDDPSGIKDTIVLRSTEQSANGSWRISDPAERQLSEPERQRYRLREDDIVVTKSSGSELHIGKASIVNAHLAKEEPAFSNFMQRLRVRRAAVPRYIWYLLNSNRARFHYNVEATSTSGLGNLTGGIIGELRVPVGALDTQKAIADLLDRETARIDQLITKKQRLVALLGEKFETETNRLMTRGVKSDKSGFVRSVYHWAPEVPAHWTQTPLRQLLRLTSRSVGEKSGDYVLLSLTKQGVIPRDIESGKGKFPSDFSTYQVVKPNQLVLCLFDVDETPRTVGLSMYKGMITGAYTVADINADRVDRDFIYYHLLYLDNGKRLRPFYTGLRKVIRPQTFLNIRIPLPPVEEQKQIVQELQHWERRAKEISKKTNASIDRLKEYRSALITAAVTGQIDVETWGKKEQTDRRLDQIEQDMSLREAPA